MVPKLSTTPAPGRCERPSTRAEADGRRPPHDLEAEESLLGAMLLSQRPRRRSGRRLSPPATSTNRPTDTSSGPSGPSWAGGEAIDAVTVTDKLER